MEGSIKAPSRMQFLTAKAMVDNGYTIERAAQMAVAKLAQESQANRMKARANRSSTPSRVINVGNIVHFKTSPFDRAKTDPTYSTGIVVERKGPDAYIIANEAGSTDAIQIICFTNLCSHNDRFRWSLTFSFLPS